MSMDTSILFFGDNGQTGFPSIKPSNFIASYALIDEQSDMIIM